MGTTTGVGFVPTPTQVEEYTHRLTGNKTGTVYTHTHTHTLDVRSRQPPEPTGSTPEETNRGSGAACYIGGGKNLESEEAAHININERALISTFRNTIAGNKSSPENL